MIRMSKHINPYHMTHCSDDWCMECFRNTWLGCLNKVKFIREEASLHKCHHQRDADPDPIGLDWHVADQRTTNVADRTKPIMNHRLAIPCIMILCSPKTGYPQRIVIHRYGSMRYSRYIQERHGDGNAAGILTTQLVYTCTGQRNRHTCNRTKKVDD